VVKPDAVLISGVIMAEIPALCIQKKDLGRIKEGEKVKLDAKNGFLEI
jgi:predicted aconitase with swiveling domain